MISNSERTRKSNEEGMTQDEQWLKRYEELKDFMETNHMNPSKHFAENRNILWWWKHQRKLVNAGKMRPDRIAFFEELLELREKYKRVNQWG